MNRRLEIASRLLPAILRRSTDLTAKEAAKEALEHAVVLLAEEAKLPPLPPPLPPLPPLPPGLTGTYEGPPVAPWYEARLPLVTDGNL